jgi:hypothetical protein
MFCSFLDQVEINRFFAKKIKKIKVQDCVISASKTKTWIWFEMQHAAICH